MAKKNKSKSAVGLSILALIIGVVIGAGGNFGITTATYDESANTTNNETVQKQEAANNKTTNNGVVYSNLQINFLELGNKYAGDCTYIKAGDTDILIDGGSRVDSASTIKNYIDQYCSDGKLEYVIATHGHQDHIAALVGNKATKGLLQTYDVGTLIYFARTNNETSSYVTKLKNTIVPALEKAGTKVYTADEAFAQIPSIEVSSGIYLKTLWNKYYYENSSDENDHSVISLITYGEHNYLFTGDLELGGEEAFASYYDGSTSEKTLPSHVDLYKGGHHGSKTSSNDCLLDLVDPQMCCVCCCAGSTEYTVNRENTFPTQKFIDRIAKHTDEVYLTSRWDDENQTYTSMNGNITVSSDGTNVGLAASNNLTKLKDTEWFSHLVYVNDKDQIVSKDKSTKQVACRTLPSQWQ